MESLVINEVDKIDKKGINCLNGGIFIKNNPFNKLNFNALNQKELRNHERIKSFQKKKKKVSIDKILPNNSSFLGFRKNSNGNMKKDITLNENNISVISMNNLSYSNLLDDKNENIFRQITRKEVIKEKNENNTTINKINTIYENRFRIQLIQKKKDKKYRYLDNNKLNNDKDSNKDNQMKINNYIKDSKNINNLESSHMFRKNSSKILKRYCFICEVFEEKLYHTKNCSHLFCKDCGKYYFEQQIEKGIYNLQCPKYECYNKLNLKDIKEILTPESYLKVEVYSKLNKTKITNKKDFENNFDIINNINSKRNSKNTVELNINNDSYTRTKYYKKNLLKTQIPKSNKKENVLHFVLKKHMIKMSDYTRFKSRVKHERDMKKVVCSKCGKSALFSREDQNFIRCLNCGNAICKYCHKKLDAENTLKKLNSLCGTCYSRIKIIKNKSFFKKLIFEILFVISGFLVFWIGLSKIETKLIIHRRGRKKYFLFIIIFIIFLLVNFTLLIIFIPFFPIFISIFGQ